MPESLPAAAGADAATPAAPFETTLDALLGGRVRIHQPREGYRIAIDAVLLAAGVPAEAGETVLDLGTGVAAAALCLAARVPGASVVGVERQAALVHLAEANIELNGCAGRVRVVAGDLRYPVTGLAAAGADRVMANPPYLRGGAHTPAPDAAKAAATGEQDGTLADWLQAAARLVRPRGSLTLIHRADRVDEAVALMTRHFGRLVLFPLWPRAGQPARRVLIHGRRGVSGPARLAAGLVLHDAGPAYTAAAEAVLRGGAGLDL